MLPNYPLACLALADGSIFKGYSIGYSSHTSGEVVFNTCITGYQEVLTDLSYSGQIVTFTYPHIGNTGINLQDLESKTVNVKGLVIKNLPVNYSNFRAHQDLISYLKDNKIVAIAGIDTRRLTNLLRNNGAQNGVIVNADNIDQAHKLIAQCPNLNGADLAKEVSTTQSYTWNQGEWCLEKGFSNLNLNADKPAHHVVVIDFGVKSNILRMLVERGCSVTVVPAQTSFAELQNLNPNGVLLSNGPGDPQACTYAINLAIELIKYKMPTFGICLGHQILGLAAGAKTLKMKFGHHGSNHPVKNLLNSKVAITSQNHGFAISLDNLPENLEPTHVSLFDGSLQGFKLKDSPCFGFQGHPEASPGPSDINYLFDVFINSMQNQSQKVLS